MKNIAEKLKNPGMEYRNEIRWWLPAGLHTDETLREEMQKLEDSGFGGVEFLALPEPGVDKRRYGWGSEEWNHDSAVLLEETTNRGMAASMTSGTHWSNANLINITPDDKAAAKELDYTVTALKAGEVFEGQLPKPKLRRPNIHVQELIAVVAARVLGEENGRQILELPGVLLTEQTEKEYLRWQAPQEGAWLLFAFWLHGTGQTNEPSCGISYTINYIDRYGADALMEYWDAEVLTPAMEETIRKNGRVQWYMDSLELTTYADAHQFWGYHLLEEYVSRRGYDLTPYLPLVLKQGQHLMDAVFYYTCGDREFEERLRNDLYQTFTEMYMENVLAPLQNWLHGHGMELRAEISYGLPFEISQPGKYVDGVETESLEFASQIDAYRGMSGTAHIYNRMFSSETGANIHNFKLPMDFYQQILYTQFAAGIARTVMHGYSSRWGSEEATQWPGHEGMWPLFAERFGDRQPAYRHYKDWNKMVERYQYLLRQGKPRVDLGIVRLDYAFDCGHELEIENYEKKFMRSHKGIYWQHTGLQDAGYTYDYFAPQMTEDMEYMEGELLPEGPGYRALMLYQEALPLPAAKRILDWAKQGLPVVLVNGVTENFKSAADIEIFQRKAAIRTPYLDGKDEALAEVITQLTALANVRVVEGCEGARAALEELGVYPRAPYAKSEPNILSNLRQDGHKYYLYLYNYMYTEKESVTFKASIPAVGTPYRANCWTGELQQLAVYDCLEDRTQIQLTLAPGEATMLILDASYMPERRVVCTNAADIRLQEACAEQKAVMIADKSGTYTVEWSDGTKTEHTVTVPAPILLDTWKLQVESWDEGERMERTEDRGLGYVSKEVTYGTKKTMLDAGETALKPWMELPAVGGEVSGIGFYSCSFERPADWQEDMGAVLRLESTNGSTAAVYVNGEKADPVDFDVLTVDITVLLKPGTNTLLVEVPSTLNNRLRQRNYYAGIRYRHCQLANAPLPEDPLAPMTNYPFTSCSKSSVQPYGLTGKACVEFYRKVEL